MFSFNKIFIAHIFIFSVFISCQNNNKIEIRTVEKLEEITLSDTEILNNININNIQNNIRLGEFNILKLEERQLDSISVELIYFEYREYLNYINLATNIVHSINNLKDMLTINGEQLNKLKLDYQESKERRNDLDRHLKNEKIFVENSSKEIKKVTTVLNEMNEQFDSLNKIIELIIYEN